MTTIMRKKSEVDYNVVLTTSEEGVEKVVRAHVLMARDS